MEDPKIYDLIVMGTGITESMLSGLCALEEMKVLHIDRNDFYGDEVASLNITTLWDRFGPKKDIEKELLPNRDWNVDLSPKFIMASGKLVKMIIKFEAESYLSWKSVDASYVYQWQEGGLFSSEKGVIEKIPSNDSEALSSNLMSLLEKRRCQKFFKFVQDFNIKEKTTWKKCDPNEPFCKLIESYGLQTNTIDFIGHAVALYTSDEFLNRPSKEVLERVKLYMESSGRYGDSHFIYPVYGIAGISESFVRRSAVHGSTFMLKVKIHSLEFDKVEKLWNVKASSEYGDFDWKTKKIIAHPIYMEMLGRGHLLKKDKVVRRVICIMDHSVPGTKNAQGAQIIIPQKQTGRNSDIFIVVLNSSYGVCKKGYYLAIISSTPERESIDEDLKVAFGLLGSVLHRFVIETTTRMPINRDFTDGLFITDTLDATSHFEAATENVLEVFRKVTGKEIDLDVKCGDLG